MSELPKNDLVDKFVSRMEEEKKMVTLQDKAIAEHSQFTESTSESSTRSQHTSSETIGGKLKESGESNQRGVYLSPSDERTKGQGIQHQL
jgi:hypothetical protein